MRRTYRSYCKITSYLNHPCYFELIIIEKQEKVIKRDGRKAIKLTKKQAAGQRLAIGSIYQ